MLPRMVSCNMDTAGSSCPTTPQGEAQPEDPNNGENVLQSTRVLLSDKNLDLVKFNMGHVPINVAYDKAIEYVETEKGNWRRTNVKIQDPSAFTFQLSCATCNKIISLRNPAGFWSTHSKTCKDNGARGQVLKAGETAVSRPGVEIASSSNTLSTFLSSAQQQEAFHRHMALACITSCVPFTFFENEHLQAAANVFGVKLPSRKVLSSTLLDKIFKEVQDVTIAGRSTLYRRFQRWLAQEALPVRCCVGELLRAHPKWCFVF